jgi:hypothetical protein
VEEIDAKKETFDKKQDTRETEKKSIPERCIEIPP